MIKLYVKENIDSNTLINIVKKDFNISGDTLYTPFGKPYIKDNPIYFNISNKDNITILVVSDTKVGIDIERLTYRPIVVNKMFNDKEKCLLESSSNKEYVFTRIYTIKEAIAKMVGLGLSLNLKYIDIFNIIDKLIFITINNYVITIVKEKV